MIPGCVSGVCACKLCVYPSMHLFPSPSMYKEGPYGFNQGTHQWLYNKQCSVTNKQVRLEMHGFFCSFFRRFQQHTLNQLQEYYTLDLASYPGLLPMFLNVEKHGKHGYEVSLDYH